MERFGYLKKKQEKALVVFRKAQDDLKRISAELFLERNKAAGRIADLRQRITDEEAVIEYLGKEGELLDARLSRIGSILD
jgi:hypothetical protein